VPDVVGKIAMFATLATLSIACRSGTRQGTDGGPTEPGERTRFVCSNARCVQTYPRFPDDGEWTCNDTAGVTVCSGGDPPAGVPFNRSDPAWICGARRSAHARREDGERVCVDFAPDFPDGKARGWRCSYLTDNDVRRVCERDDTVRVIGEPCGGRADPCLDGLRCVLGRCEPDSPSPSCILDGDCDDGTCRFGSCWRGPT
jgi:hypothetical protein